MAQPTSKASQNTPFSSATRCSVWTVTIMEPFQYLSYTHGVRQEYWDHQNSLSVQIVNMYCSTKWTNTSTLSLHEWDQSQHPHLRSAVHSVSPKRDHLSPLIAQPPTDNAPSTLRYCNILCTWPHRFANIYYIRGKTPTHSNALPPTSIICHTTTQHAQLTHLHNKPNQTNSANTVCPGKKPPVVFIKQTNLPTQYAKETTYHVVFIKQNLSS